MLSSGQQPNYATVEQPIGWRGRIRQQAQQIRHRWQRGWNSQPQDQLRGRDVWRRFRIGIWLLLALGLVALLVDELWFRPVQTPLLAISAPAYVWPLPPDAWSNEDLAGLADLDNGPPKTKTRSIHLVDISDDWRSADSGLAAFDRQLHMLANQENRSGAIILYISMHGAVDSSGRPVLIPPGASPLRSETWIKLSDLLDRIKAQNLPDSWHKLLVLDCDRIDVAWNMGILSNGFAEALPDTVTKAEIPNLAVLNSTSAGQRGWASSDLAGSVFGHFLRLGLAGAADATTEGGNGDRQVSLHELHHYLQEHVDAWVAHNRADRQQPLLLPVGAPDFTVVWSLRPAAQRELARPKDDSNRKRVTLSSINALWRRHDQIAALNPQRFDPLAWADFERKLLWLERATEAGAAYDESAGILRVQLLDQARGIETRATAAGEQPTVLARADFFNDHPTRRSTPIITNSLPLAEYLGDPDQPKLPDLRAALGPLEKLPSRAAATALLTRYPSNQHVGQFDEVQFLRLLDRDLPPAVWNQPLLLGQSLATMARGNRAAVTDDERAQFWTLPLVAAGNQAQRQANDQLFIADEAALAVAAPHWDDADAHYTQADKLARSVSDAYALRDQAWARIPYLARWLTRPLPIGEPSAPLDDEINGTLLKLIHATHGLDTALAAGQAAGAAPFDEEASEVRAGLQHLDELFSKECARLEKLKQGNASVVRRFEAALALPLVPSRQREELRKLSSQFAAKLSGEAPTDEDQKQTHDATTYCQRAIVDWHEHPALAILSIEDVPEHDRELSHLSDSSAKKETGHVTATHAPQDLLTLCVDHERRLRERLEGLPAELRRLREIGADAAEPVPTAGKPGQLDRIGAARNEADRLARAAAPIGLPPLDDDPVRRLRQWDLQRLLLWNCQRALDDFWGPAHESEQPYFALAAADYLRDVQAIGEAEPAMLAECDRMSKLLESRRLAATSGLATVASDILLVDPSDRVTIKMGVRPGRDDAVAGLPSGRAALFVRDSQGRIGGTDRSLNLPLADAANEPLKLDLAVPGTALADRGPLLQATALLRGNRFAAPFLLRSTGGVRIDVVPYHYGPPQVTLGGRSRRRASIEFILDCSHSMSDPTDMEGVGGTQRISRLDAAKMALRGMLSQLAADGDARVGVRFFGHRVGWNLKKPEQMLRQTDYAHPIPDDLRPSEDVELVLPLGRFDQVVAGGVLDTLKTLKPWGETPLFLALTQAIGDFAEDEPGTERSIIVITDGMNYQFNSPHPKTREDVTAAEGDHKIPIHIVGFGIPAAEVAQATRDFTALADQTGGSFVTVSDGTAARVRSLENLLGPKQYVVSNGEGAVIGQAQVGAAVTVVPKPNGMQPYTVALGTLTADLELAGGEHAELMLGADARSIHAAGYEHGDPEFAPLLHGGQGAATGWQFGVHRPIRQQAGVRIPVSIQRTDRQFSQRPAEVWVEIRPLGEDKSTNFPRYIFYDGNFEPGTPAPVLGLLAEEWPAAAKQAEVRVWTKFERTTPGWTMKLADVANKLPTTTAGHTLSGLPGVAYQVRAQRGAKPGERYRVAVVERYTDESTGPGSLKVELDPPPARIVHRYDRENHLATHTFYLDETDDQAVGAYELRFTRLADLQRGALQLAEPLLRGVSDTGDVIRP